jgi:hypothetical protein
MCDVGSVLEAFSIGTTGTFATIVALPPSSLLIESNESIIPLTDFKK